jgi:hypothetical protein
MSDAYLEKIAGELAQLALADEERTGDERIINDIAEIVGSSSQTLQEAFLTSVRVRRAEKRAREILAKRDPGQNPDAGRLLAGDGTSATAASAQPSKVDDGDVDTSDLQSMLDELDQQNARDAGKDNAKN